MIGMEMVLGCFIRRNVPGGTKTKLQIGKSYTAQKCLVELMPLASAPNLRVNTESRTRYPSSSGQVLECIGFRDDMLCCGLKALLSRSSGLTVISLPRGGSNRVYNMVSPFFLFSETIVACSLRQR